MKKMILGAAALTLMFTACKKNEEEKPSNNWKIGETTHTAQQVNVAGAIMTAATTENGGNSLAIAFDGTALPTTSGTYKISQSGSGSDVTVIATETSTQGAYIVQSGTLTVTVTDGKVTCDMTASNASYLGMTTKPDAMITAHIAQP